MMSGPKAARELIAFYLDAGVDALVGEEPINRMAEDIAPQRLGAAPAPGSENKTARRVRGQSPPAGANSPAAPQTPELPAAPPSPEAAVMAAIGLDRTSSYIANVVPWRPPGNRTPTPQETAICLPFIRRQIELADPEFLVCLGGPAMQTLLGIKDGITRSRGRWFSYDTGRREIRALATFHPAFLLRSPLQKRFAWRDFLALKKALAGGRG